MNNRVLELLKNPKIIQSEDLSLLKEEINSSPYIQNIRALHLYGVHLFDRENYQKELSTTAAYTTDKKILYQLINGKLQQQLSIPDVNEETKAVERDNITEKIKHDYEAVSQDLIATKPEIKHILVNGERNRILYEGEENFLHDENSETIDLESTLESGVIVTQKREIPTEAQNTEEKNIQQTDTDLAEKQSASSSYAEISENLLSEEDHTQKNQRQNTFSEPETETVPENLNVETVIDEDAIDSEKVSDKINDKSELSFLKIESFEPENEATEETQGKVHISESEIEPVAENLNVETVIDEETIDSEKVSDKVNDESELSFLKIESFEPESEVNAESLPEREDHQEESKVILNPETIINEDKIETPKIAEQIKDDAQLSFHGTESFLPEIKIETSHSEVQTKTESPKSSVNKYEEEMRRLIEEVEKRMKTQKKANTAETLKDEDEASGDEISFAETQDFVIDKKEEKENTTDSQQNISENIKNDEENKVVNSSWKPMSFENNLPDALLNKKNEADKISEKESEIVKLQDDKSGGEKKVSETEINNKTETEESKTITDDESESGEVPVMNVSFFGSEISSLLINEENKKTEEEKQQEVIADEPSKKAFADSNVPGFINTWQNWLKIDRTEEILKEKAIIKTKVIESFIENNPKISQLKDEVNFVVKEKTDDISHLMTETLANLYIEQKLYTKAINAFQILIGKHPHRKDYFEAKIQEIKDNRGKN
ncbi:MULTISPECIES: hypothetical protein [Chryseobacterium]|uniref:Uncharacterized protein n=1 Tax=Chryseobacterium taihuense TaxID=1141221 RepID=A0A4U8WNU8_9FLAO|nr:MULTISPECIES: hypothetical protein [Chryseobacterium]QQV02700.1 hypothetical protein I6I61_16800 [Chryseobacterium sp. FDAARGOS 1104]VFB04039.1 Uncharacterised protein [Chryseobacterium taihuense]